MDHVARGLANYLPDIPRWLETRALLLSGHADVTGGSTVESGFVARVLHDALSAVAVVGCPPVDAIVRATDGVTSMTPVLAQTENADHVRRALAQAPGPRWAGERAILHELRTRVASPALSPNLEIRLLRPEDPIGHLPPGLRHEIGHARAMTLVAAVFVNDVAASFCYPCWRTETLWDVSIDTLELYRGRALAERAVQFMIEKMRQEGREPVWGAVESNTASLRLATKLGFQPVESMVCFSCGPWAFLTGGFERHLDKA